MKLRVGRLVALAVSASLLLGACTATPFDVVKSVPRSQENACSIIKQRPDIKRATRRTQKRWGVPMSVQLAVMKQESSFRANAKPPRKYLLGFIPNGRVSSAYGYSQALDGTWKDYKQATGKRLARRDNIYDAADFMGWYFNNTKKQLGIPLGDARRQYLAYHEGAGGYRRGSHYKKKWLMNVASATGTRAAKYSRQLKRCL